MSFGDREDHLRAQVTTSSFVTKETVARARLGPGEDVFMVGRFVDHDGGKVNLPTVRFGNISAMPTPILQTNGRHAPVYILDMHSRDGYSGSPVFVYRTPGFDLETLLDQDPNKREVLLAGANFLSLLCIHIGQFPERWEILKGAPKEKPGFSEGSLITDGAAIRGLSGMTCVLPAWCIQEVIDMPQIKAARDRTNERLLAERASKETAPRA